MQKIQQKRPYLAPEITAVDFKVERGLDVSNPTVETSAELDFALQQSYTAGDLFQAMQMQSEWATGWGGYSNSGGTNNGGYFGYGWSNGDAGFWGN